MKREMRNKMWEEWLEGVKKLKVSSFFCKAHEDELPFSFLSKPRRGISFFFILQLCWQLSEKLKVFLSCVLVSFLPYSSPRWSCHSLVQSCFGVKERKKESKKENRWPFSPSKKRAKDTLVCNVPRRRGSSISLLTHYGPPLSIWLWHILSWERCHESPCSTRGRLSRIKLMELW